MMKKVRPERGRIPQWGLPWLLSERQAPLDDCVGFRLLVKPHATAYRETFDW